MAVFPASEDPTRSSALPPDVFVRKRRKIMTRAAKRKEVKAYNAVLFCRRVSKENESELGSREFWDSELESFMMMMGEARCRRRPFCVPQPPRRFL